MFPSFLGGSLSDYSCWTSSSWFSFLNFCQEVGVLRWILTATNSCYPSPFTWCDKSPPNLSSASSSSFFDTFLVGTDTYSEWRWCRSAASDEVSQKGSLRWKLTEYRNQQCLSQWGCSYDHAIAQSVLHSYRRSVSLKWLICSILLFRVRFLWPLLSCQACSELRFSMRGV